jgi:hypothetical protein
MSSIVIDDQTLKGLLKEALIEVLQERPGLLRDMLTEAVEDIGLARAIREGQDTAEVSKEAVLKALE